jgi:hypothetical protein
MGCNSSVNEGVYSSHLNSKILFIFFVKHFIIFSSDSDIQKDRKRLNSTNPNSPGPQKSSQIAAPASASHASSSKPVGIVSGSMCVVIAFVRSLFQ